MLFNLGYQSVTLLFFVVQGLIFSFLLIKRGIGNGSNPDKWLSLLVFLCVMYLCPWTLGHAGWYGHDIYRDILYFIPFHQILLIGPVTYFYVRSLLDVSFRFGKKEALHLIPASVYMLYSIVVAITDLIILDEYYFYADGRDKDLSPWYQILGVLSMITYALLSLKIYLRYRRDILNLVSFAESIKLKWVQQFLIALCIILLVRITFLVLFPDWGDFGTKWWHYVAFAVLAYYIAITGYSNTIKATIALSEDEDPSTNDIQDEAGQTSVTPKNDIDVEHWKVKVEQLLRESMCYKNPELSLSELAQQLGLSNGHLSRVINKGFSLNFNDFINQYRIEAVKSAINEGADKRLTLLAIALDSGFNSKTTFNRAFKKHMAMTPNEYVNKVN